MKDKGFWGLIGAAVVFLAAAAWMTGCNWREVIPVNTPAAAVGDGTRPRMSLADSEAAFEVWKVKTTRAAQDWASRIEDGNNRIAFVQSLIQLGWGQAEAAFPGGTLIFGGLLASAGLIKRKPGDASKIAALESEVAALKAGKPA
jgi:hypothetical protein